jgi:endonuclease YncB( thermonuclease family)
MRTSASSNWGELLAARASRRIAPDRLPSRTKPCERVMSSRDRWLQNGGLRLSVGEWAFMGERLRPVLALLATVSIAVIGCGSGIASPAATEVDATAVSMTAPALAATPWATVKPAFEPTGRTETVNVVRIVDGDTIVVSLAGKDVKVRYIGMDTPEDVKPESPVEPMSREAAAANTRLVGGQTVVMEKDISETDQYGRLLRYVWLHQGPTWTLVNLELVRLGYATALRYPPDVKYADLFDAAQSRAESSLLGIWGLTSTPATTPAPTPKPTPRPTPRPTPKPTKAASRCHPSYEPCLPIVADLDCPEVRAMGLAPVHVIGPDDYRLDRDHDGLGCE